MAEKKTWWISKYALTTGIFAVTDGALSHANQMLWSRRSGFFHGNGREFHDSLEGALARAEVMREAKVASLKKQIKRIEAIDFRKAFEAKQAKQAKQAEQKAKTK